MLLSRSSIAVRALLLPAVLVCADCSSAGQPPQHLRASPAAPSASSAQATSSASTARRAPPRFRRAGLGPGHATQIVAPLGAGNDAGAWLCRAWERFGAPDSIVEYDIRFDVRDDESGIDLAIWVPPSGQVQMGPLTYLENGTEGVPRILAALEDFLRDAPPRDCEATFTRKGTAWTLGARAGTPFEEKAAFDKGLAAQLRRTGLGFSSREDHRWALQFWASARSEDREAHPEALPVLAATLVRWFDFEMNASRLIRPPGSREAACRFALPIRALIPISKVSSQDFERKCAR
jgi:hypothetical protein